MAILYANFLRTCIFIFFITILSLGLISFLLLLSLKSKHISMLTAIIAQVCDLEEVIIAN